LAAYLDNCLAELFLQLSKHPKEIGERLLAESRPLGAFGPKIDLAWSLGWISDEAYHDLNVIRRIRNEFAHDTAELSFTTPPIDQMCKSLRLPNSRKSDPRMTDYDDNRLCFMVSSALCDGEILRSFEATINAFQTTQG